MAGCSFASGDSGLRQFLTCDLSSAFGFQGQCTSLDQADGREMEEVGLCGTFP